MTTQHQAPEVTSELAGCPFCGASPSDNHNAVQVQPYVSHGEWSLICERCQVESGIYLSKAEAITAWNTRATQPLSLTVDEEWLRDCLYELLDEHDPSCGHFDITHTAEKIAPLLLDRLQSLSLPVGDADLLQTVAAWRDHFAPDGKRIRLDPANKESLHAVLGRVVATLGEQIAENANCSGDIERSGLAQEVE